MLVRSSQHAKLMTATGNKQGRRRNKCHRIIPARGIQSYVLRCVADTVVPDWPSAARSHERRRTPSSVRRHTQSASHLQADSTNTAVCVAYAQDLAMHGWVTGLSPKRPRCG
jgi:hypothetical protein